MVIILLVEILSIPVQIIWGMVLLGLNQIHNQIFLFSFFFRSHKNKSLVSLTILPTCHGAPIEDIP